MSHRYQYDYWSPKQKLWIPNISYQLTKQAASWQPFECFV